MGSDKFSHKIQIELIKLLFQQAKFAIWAESFAALGLTLALWGTVTTKLLISWLISNLLFCGLARHMMIFYYQKFSSKNILTYQNLHNWLLIFCIGAFVSGLSWGATGSILMVDDMVRQRFAVFLLIGVTAAANPFYSPVRRVYALFLLPAFVPFSIWSLLQGNIFIILSFLSIIYIIVMLATSFYSHKLIYTSLYLRFENLGLIDNLSKAKHALENRSHELEKSLSLFRATLESTTDGILVMDVNKKLENFNKKFINMWQIPFFFTKGKNVYYQLIDFIQSQLIDPLEFRMKITKLEENSSLESFDELIFKDGRVFEYYSKPQIIGENYVGRVWSFRDITERKLLESKLYHQANFDSLTGLPNRVLVLDRITQAIIRAEREKNYVAVLFVDVDGFKFINDTSGHTCGDKLLKLVAERLEKCVRGSDTVSRSGGDEFLIILTSLKNEYDSADISKKCLDSFLEPFLIDNKKFTISVSIGISFYPKHGKEAEILIRNADIAMYQAKEYGRNNFQFFTEELNKKVQIRLHIENQLRNSLQQNEFFLLYQPILDLKTNAIVGVESLLRWHHPELGSILPADFISVAEECGMIIPIGDFVLKFACMQASIWKNFGFKNFNVSVNLSARQFKQENLFEKINNALNEYNIEPHYLALELTENILMSDVELNIKILKRLKLIGIVIIMDDFGTGYSRLNYLKQLPVDKLKIDISFIKDIIIHKDAASVTAAMIALANKLNIKVIAEGVENEQQLNFLRNHHCDEIQGFYFSKPLDEKSCTEFFIKNSIISYSV